MKSSIEKVVETFSEFELRDRYQVFTACAEDKSGEDREAADVICVAIEREAGRRWLKGETGEGE